MAEMMIASNLFCPFEIEPEKVRHAEGENEVFGSMKNVPTTFLSLVDVSFFGQAVIFPLHMHNEKVSYIGSFWQK